MALTVNTNIPSLNAQRNLGQTSNMLNKSLQRLSSGLRINSAKDDAAGLAIANRMTSAIRGLNQAVRNANDGISLAQTAEGALQESTSILQRIRELAVQASSDGATDTDRESMQTEVSQLISELDRIASKTSFNNQVLLDGSFSNAKFQVGSEAGDTISMSLSSAKASSLSGNSTSNGTVGSYTLAKDTSSAGTMTDVSGTLSLAKLSQEELTIDGVEIGSGKSGYDTVSSTDNESSAISIATAINAKATSTGVRAYAEATTYKTSGAANISDAGGSISAGEIKINGVAIGAVTETTNVALDLAALRAAINAKSDETGVIASESATELTLTAVDGRNIQIEIAANATGAGTIFGTDFTAGGSAQNKAIRGTVSLYSNEVFTIGGSDPGDIGFSAGTVSLDEKLWTDTSASGFETLGYGDLVINGYNVIAPSTVGDEDGNGQSAGDTPQTASAKAIAYAINNTDGLKNEVTASAKTVANLGIVSTYDASGSATDLVIQVNGKAITFDEKIESGDATGYMVAELNTTFAAATDAAAEYGLVASINDDGELIITSDSGVNIDINVTTPVSTSVLSNVDVTDVATEVMAKGSVSLTAKTGFSIESIEGDKQALAGFTSGTSGGTVASVSVATYETAQTAIGIVDGALATIDEMRGDLGAIQNRFDSTVSNLTNVSENISAAKSRIMDADFAAETAAMTKAQIMQQAGVSMLAQANQLPQMVLQLLQ